MLRRAGDLHATTMRPLVRRNYAHTRRLTHDRELRSDIAVHNIFKHGGGTHAPDFLVVGEREMQRNPQLRPRDLRQKPQCHAQEAFHIAYATPVGARTLNPQRERIGIPGLPFDRNHIGVAGNHDAALG